MKAERKKAHASDDDEEREREINDAIDRIASNNVLDDLCCCGSFIVENSKTNSCQLSIVLQKKHHRPIGEKESRENDDAENFGAPRAGLHREI